MLAMRTHRVPGTPVGSVVAVHGLMESGACLARAARTWTDRGWTVSVPDLRGHGASPRWAPADLVDGSGDLMVADLLDVLESLERSADLHHPLVLFGHSAGGAVAAGVVEHRHDVAALLLEDPFWRLPVTFRQDPAVAVEAHARLLVRQSTRQDDLIARQTSAEPAWSADEVVAWARAKATADPAIVRHGIVVPRRGWPHLLADARAAGTRVHVVTGTEGTGITPEHQAVITAAGGTVTVIGGASHFVQRSRPAAFDADIRRVLDSVAAARAA